MKRVLICCAVAMFVICGTSLSSFADKGPEVITMESKKKPAVFPHKKHQDAFSCADCHHSMGDDGKQVAYAEGQAVEKCASCHNKEKLAGKTLGKLKLDTIKGAGHGNCLACHKAKAKENADLKKIAKCGTCHPKKKK